MKSFYSFLILLTFFSTKDSFSQSVNSDFESSAPGTYTSATSVTGWTIGSKTATIGNTSTLLTAGSPEFSLISTGNYPNGIYFLKVYYNTESKTLNFVKTN